MFSRVSGELPPDGETPSLHRSTAGTPSLYSAGRRRYTTQRRGRRRYDEFSVIADL
ncbi:MAG: hypothetical protein IKX30_16920 [Victivallales bacterium]|nr:hypothetical protein [Victivallales bacterium]